VTKIWDAESQSKREPPAWSLTGHMLLWNDGSPAHVQQEPFASTGAGWEAVCRVSRSGPRGDRWLKLVLRLEADVRTEWDRAGTSQRARALQALAIYLRLREWYGDDLGVLELK
jgi:hypothetical protein